MGQKGEKEIIFLPSHFSAYNPAVAWFQSGLNKDVAVECLVGETPTSATETVALPETKQHTATSIFEML
jgi:hypothetical protein